MWHAWDMAAETCLAQLPMLLSDPNAEFQPSPFFTDQLTAFEMWLQHGSEKKKPPEQLPIVLQVLYIQSHRFRALVLLGRFLDMGAWAVDLVYPCFIETAKLRNASLRNFSQLTVTNMSAE
jgi:regulator-associated protein of mTOR